MAKNDRFERSVPPRIGLPFRVMAHVACVLSLAFAAFLVLDFFNLRMVFVPHHPAIRDRRLQVRLRGRSCCTG